MHTVSVRTMQDLAFERGEEFDPSLFASDGLLEGLSLASIAAPIVEAPSEYDRRRRNARERRRALRSIPAWFEAQDLAPLEHIHGELV